MSLVAMDADVWVAVVGDERHADKEDNDQRTDYWQTYGHCERVCVCVCDVCV